MATKSELPDQERNEAASRSLSSTADGPDTNSPDTGKVGGLGEGDSGGGDTGGQDKNKTGLGEP